MSKLSKMQGTSGYIEYHWEAVPPKGDNPRRICRFSVPVMGSIEILDYYICNDPEYKYYQQRCANEYIRICPKIRCRRKIPVMKNYEHIDHYTCNNLEDKHYQQICVGYCECDKFSSVELYYVEKQSQREKEEYLNIIQNTSEKKTTLKKKEQVVNNNSKIYINVLDNVKICPECKQKCRYTLVEYIKNKSTRKKINATICPECKRKYIKKVFMILLRFQVMLPILNLFFNYNFLLMIVQKAFSKCFQSFKEYAIMTLLNMRRTVYGGLLYKMR